MPQSRLWGQEPKYSGAWALELEATEAIAGRSVSHSVSCFISSLATTGFLCLHLAQQIPQTPSKWPHNSVATTHEPPTLSLRF